MRLRSLEQLMPFATAGELLAQKRRSLVTVFAITLIKTAAVAVAISVYYLTGLY